MRIRISIEPVISVLRPRDAVKLIGIFFSVTLLLVLAACGDDEEDKFTLGNISRSPETPIVIQSGEPIVVGVSTALTGPIGPRGSEYRDAVVAGVERWKSVNGALLKGHEIEVQAEDDGCTAADVARAAADRLLGRQGLVGVIGPQCSGGTAAVITKYAEAGIVAISGSATRTDLTPTQPAGRFFFRTAYRNDLEGALIGSFLIDELNVQTVYVIDDSEPYGEDLADVTQRLLEENGVQVTRASVQQGDVDFSNLAATIAGANPDFVGFAGFNPEAALLYRQLRDAGYSGAFGSVDAAASVSEFVEPLGEAAEGVLFAGCRVKLPNSFVDDYRAVHGHDPGTATFIGHYADAAWILLDAVASVAQEQPDGSILIEPLALRDAVRAANLRTGVTGPIAFDSNGDRVPERGDDISLFIQRTFEDPDTDVFVSLGLVPCQVQDGTLVNLSGPDAGTVR